jgi:predicted transposase YbfD/YdcC
MKNPCATIVKHFATLPDPRMDRTKLHKLTDIMTIAICSVLCMGDTYVDMEDFGQAKAEWLSTFLALPNGIPSHDTFNRVFRALDPEAFEKCFVSWVNSLREMISKEIVAIDGKTLRRSFDNASGQSALHIVGAWARENELALGQVAVDDKSNEITAIPKLLRLLDLEGCIVTIDAMGCQKTIAGDIRDQGADYVLELKKNHGNLFAATQTFFEEQTLEDFADLPHEYHETIDGNHGRREIRRYWITSEIAWSGAEADWPDLQSIAMVERIRTLGDKTETEIHFYLTSLEAKAPQFARAVRGHWSVENSLHWTLDVTFREDEARARKDHAAQNFATLRKIALNLIKTDQSRTGSIRAKRRVATLDDTYLLQLLLGKAIGISGH